MPEKCVWCRKPSTVESLPSKDPQAERLPVCSEGCRSRAGSFLAYCTKTRWYLLAGVLVLIVSGTISAALGLVDLLPLHLTAFGVLIIVFPFPTRETVVMMGIPRAMLLVRVVGLLAIVLSAGFWNMV